MHKTTRVLFLGTANAGRSLMAEALLRQRAGDRFEAYSAGLAPTTVSPLTLQVLEEIGVPTDALHAKNVDEYLGKLHFGYVITVCDYAEQHCPTAFLSMGQRLHWSIQDPLKVQGNEEETVAAFRRTCGETDLIIQTWLTEQL